MNAYDDGNEVLEDKNKTENLDFCTEFQDEIKIASLMYRNVVGPELNNKVMDKVVLAAELQPMMAEIDEMMRILPNDPDNQISDAAV